MNLKTFFTKVYMSNSHSFNRLKRPSIPSLSVSGNAKLLCHHRLQTGNIHHSCEKRGAIKGEISINEALTVVVVLVVFPQILQCHGKCPTESSVF